MKAHRQLFRLIYIHYILAKYGLDELLFATKWLYPLRFFQYLNPWYWRNRKESPAIRLRLALEQLGPIFVKFGQMLSARPDLLPEDYIQSLSLLQDRVRPFPKATLILEKIYQQSLSDIFSNISAQPLASASIAQVHAVTLHTGQEAVVKILRPQVKSLIEQDIALLYSLATLFERYFYMGRRLRAREIVAEFEHTLLDELDLIKEAANSSILRRNFLHSTQLFVPEVYWPYCRQGAIVMERMYGIPIGQTSQLIEANINLKRLAESIIELFFTQVFRDSFFHADMHPGNIFVSPLHPHRPQVILVDCGIMGSLTKTDQRYLAENMLAFLKRDYRRVAELHIACGWLPPETRIQDFESAISTVCEPIFEKPLRDISFGQLLLRLFQTGKKFHMEIQPQLLLLQKTLLNIEGLARQLYPEMAIWQTAQPHLEKWLKTQVGPQAFFRKIKDNLPFWFEKLPDLPTYLIQKMEIDPQRKPTPYQSTVEANPGKTSLLAWLVPGLIGLILGGTVVWAFTFLR